MQSFIIQWWLAAVFGVIFGYIVSTIKSKSKVSRAMINTTSERLEHMERTLFILLGKEIKCTFNKYKSKRKIPDDEMEWVELIYKEYSTKEPNGVMHKRVEQMRAWATTSDDDK